MGLLYWKMSNFVTSLISEFGVPNSLAPEPYGNFASIRKAIDAGLETAYKLILLGVDGDRVHANQLKLNKAMRERFAHSMIWQARNNQKTFKKLTEDLLKMGLIAKDKGQENPEISSAETVNSPG